MKGLIPAAIMQVVIAAVLARLRSSPTLAKMATPPLHLALLAEGDVWLTNGVGIVEVVGRAREEKDVFMIGGGACLDRARHGVRLVPDAVAPQDPASID